MRFVLLVLVVLALQACAPGQNVVKDFSWRYPETAAPGEGLLEVVGQANGATLTANLDVATPVATATLDCRLVFGSQASPGKPIDAYQHHGAKGALAFGYDIPDGVGPSLVAAKVVYGGIVQCTGDVDSALAESVVAILGPPGAAT